MYVLACIAPQRAANRGRRVLVLDDNAVSCNVMVSILADAGFPTDTRATSEAAFDVLARGQHRVLIADQHRGPIDGLAVARRIQEEHPSVSIILLTGDKALPAAVDGAAVLIGDQYTVLTVRERLEGVFRGGAGVRLVARFAEDADDHVAGDGVVIQHEHPLARV